MIHWLAFTLQADLDAVLALLPYPLDWVEMQGQHGYSASLRSGEGVAVYYLGRPGMGVHVVITGAGCDSMSTRGLDWQAWLSTLVIAGAVFSRVDIARDDTSGEVTPKRVYDAFLGAAVSTRLRGARFMTSTTRGALVQPGTTCYIGSTTSDSMLRVYDKASESGRTDITWTRVEAQYRRKRAHAVAVRLAAVGLECVKSLIAAFLRPLERSPEEGENITRVPTASWWSKFLQCATAQPLIVARKALTVMRVCQNVAQQYGPSILAVVRATGGWDFLRSAIDLQAHRMRPKHLRLSIGVIQ